MLGAVTVLVMFLFSQDIFVISHSPSGMETGKSKSEERSQLLTDPVVTGIAYEINKANKKLNQHRLQVCTHAVCKSNSGMLLRSVDSFTACRHLSGYPGTHAYRGALPFHSYLCMMWSQ